MNVCAPESRPPRPAAVKDLPGWAHGFRAWLRGVPGLPHVVLIRWCELSPVLDQVESLLTVFSCVGREGFDLVAAANSSFSYVLARAELEEAIRASGVRRSLPWVDGHPNRPLLGELRAEYAVARLDEHFSLALELVLDGLLERGGG